MFRIARRVCLAAATVVLLAPISANAASYEVHACSLPNGFPTGSDGWLPIGGGNGINLDNSCRAGTGVAGQMYGAGRQTVAPHLGGFAFTAPPGTTVVGVTLDRAARPDSHFSPNTYWYVTQGLPETVQPYLLENCTIGAGFCSAGKGSFSNRPDPTNRVSFLGLPRPASVRVSQHVGVGQVSEPSLARFAIYRAVVGLLDESPPVVSAATGRLAAGESVTGDTSVTVTAGDSGGGIAKSGCSSTTRSWPSARSTRPTRLAICRTRGRSRALRRLVQTSRSTPRSWRTERKYALVRRRRIRQPRREQPVRVRDEERVPAPMARTRQGSRRSKRGREAPARAARPPPSASKRPS